MGTISKGVGENKDGGRIRERLRTGKGKLPAVEAMVKPDSPTKESALRLVLPKRFFSFKVFLKR